MKPLERVKRVLEQLVHEKFSKRNWLKKFKDPCLAKKMRSERSRVVLHCGEVFKIAKKTASVSSHVFENNLNENYSLLIKNADLIIQNDL